MIKHILFLFSVIFLLSACKSKSDRVKPPKTILNEKELVEVLVDLHLAEGVFKSHYQIPDLRNNNNPNEYYEWVLQKHGIEKEKLEESLIFYGRYPDQYKSIYEKALNCLNEMEAQIKAQEQVEQERKAIEEEARLKELSQQTSEELKISSDSDSVLMAQDTILIRQDTTLTEQDTLRTGQ